MIGGASAHFVLVKGSPEVIGSLSVPGTLPSWYHSTYEKLARKGLRVLALGLKRVNPMSAVDSRNGISANSGILDGTSRENAEMDLTFCGFIAFECKIRADSQVIVRSLRESDHSVAMLTGDALLTSMHVAKMVGICDSDRECVILKGATVDETAEPGSVSYRPVWVRRNDATGDEEEIPIEMAPVTNAGESHLSISDSHLHEIASQFNILTTETELFALAENTGGDLSTIWKYVGFIRVFARMSPQGKATIIRQIKDLDVHAARHPSDPLKQISPSSSSSSREMLRFQVDPHVMMCGDGGNDVGALKQVINHQLE